MGGRYLIGKIVSANGEGFTYNAFDLELKKPVSLREFYPKGLISRGEGNYCLVNVGKVTEFMGESINVDFSGKDFNFAEFENDDVIRLDFTEDGVDKTLRLNLDSGESNVFDVL